MSSRESLSFVSKSIVRLRVLHAAAEPSTLNELVERLPHSRPPIRNAVDWYVDHDWLRKHDSVYCQTATGASVLHHLDGTDWIGANSLSCEEIQFICGSPVRFSLLQHSSLPNTANELTRYCDAVSTAAGRMMEMLVDRGWYERQGETNVRTAAGNAAYTDLVRLLAVLDQLADKKPLFDRLPTHLADLPVTALRDANLFTPADGPDAGLASLRRIGDRAPDNGFNQIRTVCPVYRPSLTSTMREYIAFDTETAVVYDQPTFRKLCAPENLPMLAATVAHPHTEVRVYPDDLSFGVGTYDEQGMLVPYNEQPGNAAGIASANQDLIEWMDTTFEDYWEHSQPVSRGMTDMLSKYATTTIWGVKDTTFWAAKDEDRTASTMLYDLITS